MAFSMEEVVLSNVRETIVLLALLGAAAPAAAQSAPPAWLQSRPADKLAVLTVDMTRDGGGLVRLNGERDGAVQVVVPKGWTLEWRFRNLDSLGTHSLVVMAEREKLPLQGGQPAFSGGMTRMLVPGLPRATGERPQDVTRIDLDESGWYWLLDGVPGEALKGAFIGLKVDAAATDAQVVRKKG
jgi:hypothetical protein